MRCAHPDRVVRWHQEWTDLWLNCVSWSRGVVVGPTDLDVDDRPEFCADLADTRPVSIVRSTAILVVAVGLAANGVSMVTCLVVIALAPAHCIVVGERLGSEGR